MPSAGPSIHASRAGVPKIGCHAGAIAALDPPEVAGDDTPRSVALEDDDLLVAPGLATAAADKGESAVHAPLCPGTRPQCRSEIHLRTRMHVDDIQGRCGAVRR